MITSQALIVKHQEFDPKSKLLSTLDDAAFYKAIDRLLELRREHPAYPDHELLLYALTKEIQKNEVVAAARAWRETPCSMPKPDNRFTADYDELTSVLEEFCYGDNHQMECAVERARGDLLSALDKLDRLEGRR